MAPFRPGVSLPQLPQPWPKQAPDFTPSYGSTVPEYGQYQQLQMPQTRVTRAEPLTFGLNTKVAPPDLPPGATPTAQNFLVRDGGIEPRYKLAQFGAASGLHDYTLGATEYSTTTGARYPVFASAGTLAYWNPSGVSGAAWYSLSYYTKGYQNDPPTGANTDYWDFATVYDPVLDENALIATNGVNQAFWWGGPASSTATVYSALTSGTSLIAKYVAEFDNRVVFGYINDGQGHILPQRIVWTGQGAPYTANLLASDGGYYDILDAQGRIQRLVTDGARLLVFFEGEIWQGYKADYPFDFQFVRLNPTLGLAAPFSVAKTPAGVAFLGSDYKAYLIPPGGTPQPISDAIWASMRDEIDTPQQAVGVYDPRLGEYQLYYPVAGGSTRPTHSRHYNIADQTWTPHTFGHDIDALTVAQLSSSGTTFGGLVGSFAVQPYTYGQLAGVVGPRVVLAGTSNGTVGQFSSGATGDLGTAVDSQQLLHIGNPSPDRRQLLKELWLDYRADSASSLTIKVSKDFGQSFTQTYSVALPAASPSAQTVVQVMLSAVYPSVQVETDGGTRFRLQRILARLEDAGRG